MLELIKSGKGLSSILPTNSAEGCGMDVCEACGTSSRVLVSSRDESYNQWLNKDFSMAL